MSRLLLDAAAARKSGVLCLRGSGWRRLIGGLAGIVFVGRRVWNAHIAVGWGGDIKIVVVDGLCSIFVLVLGAKS